MKYDFEIRGDKVSIFLRRRDESVIETIIDKDNLQIAQSLRGRWYAQWSDKTKSFYAVSRSPSNKTNTHSRLHRLITDAPEWLEVDHINHDTLDNTSENLRNVTRSENAQNKRDISSRNKSGFRGVYWHEGNKRWRARVTVNKKVIDLGEFTDVKQAGEAALRARVEFMPFYIAQSY